jgi:hypothetical protein
MCENNCHEFLVRKWRKKSRSRREALQSAANASRRADTKIPAEDLNILAETLGNIFGKNGTNATATTARGVATKISPSKRNLTTSYSKKTVSSNLIATKSINQTITPNTNVTVASTLNATLSQDHTPPSINSSSSSSPQITVLHMTSSSQNDNNSTESDEDNQILVVERNRVPLTTTANKMDLFDREMLEKTDFFEKFLIGVLVTVSSVFTALVIFTTVRFLIRQVRRKPYSSIELTNLKGYYD